MGRAKRKQQPVFGSGMERAAALARDARFAAERDAPLVNPHAAQHGDYAPAGQYGDARKARVNRGGTPIARWRAAGLLTPSQEAAIAHCIRLWELVGSSRGLVANLQRIGGEAGDGHPAEVIARTDLHRIKGYFAPLPYWDVFENVVRFDEPAGVAGSRLAGPDAARETAARVVVQFVADIVAMRERLTY